MPGKSTILSVIESCSSVVGSLTSSITFLYVSTSVLAGSSVNDNNFPLLLVSEVLKTYECHVIKDIFGSLI